MMSLQEPCCPFCKKKPDKPIKQWEYSGTKVSRFQCKCGKFFNIYKGKKSYWTIPKEKNEPMEKITKN